MNCFITSADAYMFVLEVLLSIVELFFILRFYNRVYGKANISNRTLCPLSAMGIIAITCFMRVILHPIRPAAWPPITTLFSLVFLAYYPANRQKKILYSITLMTVSCIWLFTCDLITSPLAHKNIWLVTILIHLGFCGLIELIRKLTKNKKYNIPYFLWFLLLAITVTSMIALGIIWYYAIHRDDPYMLTIEIPILLVLLFTNISLFVFFDRFSALMYTQQEKVLLEQQIEMQNEHHKSLEATHDQFRKIHHEMNNYIRTATQLAESQGSNDELINFLNTASGQLEGIELVITTGNRFLDSILNIKIAELLRDNIKVDVSIHIPPNMNLSFEQSVTIFGNLMDNAKEACQNLSVGERWAYLKMSYTNHALFIYVENSTEKIKHWNNGLPISIKNDKDFHGLGLKNVKKSVEEIGSMHMESKDNSFIVQIAIYDL